MTDLQVCYLSCSKREDSLCGSCDNLALQCLLFDYCQQLHFLAMLKAATAWKVLASSTCQRLSEMNPTFDWSSSTVYCSVSLVGSPSRLTQTGTIMECSVPPSGSKRGQTLAQCEATTDGLLSKYKRRVEF